MITVIGPARVKNKLNPGFDRLNVIAIFTNYINAITAKGKYINSL